MTNTLDWELAYEPESHIGVENLVCQVNGSEVHHCLPFGSLRTQVWLFLQEFFDVFL